MNYALCTLTLRCHYINECKKLDNLGVPEGPSPLKCVCAPHHQISAKRDPQKARNRDKAKYPTKLHNLRIDCVNVNNEE